jgi:iron complex outermembrane receptor protein
VSFTLDYYNIRRDDEIVPAPLGLEPPVRGVQQPGTTYPGPIIYYPQPYVNAANSMTSGYDGSLQVGIPLGTWGRLTLGLDANYVITSDQTFFDPINGNATYHYAGTAGPTAVGGAVGTPRTRGSVSLDWTRGPLSLGTIVYYRGEMKGIDESTSGDQCLQLSLSNPHCYIASFTYADFYGQYSFNDHFQLSGTISNAFSTLAPLNTVTYGGFNYNPSLDQPGAVLRYYQLGLRYRF